MRASSAAVLSARRVGLALVLAGVATAQRPPAPAPGRAIDYATQVRPLLAEHCFRCHGEAKQKGDVRLDVLDPAMATRATAEGWHAALDMIHAGKMPPRKEPQWSDAQRRLVVEWLTESLAAAAIAQQGDRRVVLRRLTRAQYTHSLQDVLGLPIEFGRVLPEDARSKMGFGNNGELLQASPLHLDYFQQLAREGLDQAIAVGERPAVTRYRVIFGTGIGKGLVAAEVGGYQSVPLSANDFKVEILDRDGRPLVAATAAQRAEQEAVLRRIGVGLRGSGQDRFRSTEAGMVLLSALPHKEKVPEAWQGPSPNLKLEMQRCWPERGDFAMRVRASRGRVPPLQEQLLVALDEQVALARVLADGEVQAGAGGVVLPAGASEERDNLRLVGDTLVPVDVPKPSRARLTFHAPTDGFWQVDLVHAPSAPDAMASVRLKAAGHRLDRRPELTAEQRQQARVVTPLGALGVRAGDHHLEVGGPFFAGFSHLVVSPLPASHPLVSRLGLRLTEQNAAVADLVPVIRAYVGTRTDDGMDYATFGAPQEVLAPLGAPQTYEFFGRLENLPIPDVDPGDTEVLSGFLLLGLWNDHLVKSPKQTGPPLLIESIEFEAPFHTVWPPASHTAIFFPSHLRPSALGGDAEAYTREVLARFCERAFRRAARPDEVERYLAFWRTIRGDHAVYEHGVREVLVAILCSPSFLYLAEGEDEVAADGALSTTALASRLAYFLTDSPPDAELRRAAAAGTLAQDLAAQADRLLDSAAAPRFVRAFTAEWLRLDRHAAMTIDPDRHPDYTRFVKRDMAEETVQFVQHVLREDLPLDTLLDSDFAMLNQNLAEFYGVAGVVGPHFRPVPVRPEQHRGGLLSQGSFLAGHSDGSEPHPIKRAVWLKGRILGDPPPPPPPNVPELDRKEPGFQKLSLKEHLEKHRDSASCRDCHAGIDPFGVPFEQFSAVGRFETTRRRQPIDASAVLPDGTAVDGVAGLQAWLLRTQRDAFARALLGQLFAYALGRDLHFADQKELDAMLEQVKSAGYRARAVVRSIVTSPSFTHR